MPRSRKEQPGGPARRPRARRRPAAAPPAPATPELDPGHTPGQAEGDRETVEATIRYEEARTADEPRGEEVQP